jgi:anti-sigma B factor antagonist
MMASGASEMIITELEDFGATVYKLQGRVDNDGVDLLKQCLGKAHQDGKFKLVLEMSGVEYINSAGLRILAEFLTESREKRGDLRLVGLNYRVRRVFEIVGFSKFFRIYNTVLEAIDGLE